MGAKRQKRLSALAQCLVFYAERGVTRTCDLAAATGYSRRSIEMAKRELAEAASAKPASHDTANSVSHSDAKPVSYAKPVSHETAKPASHDANSASHGQKEIPPTPPKEKYITTVLPSSSVAARDARESCAALPETRSGNSTSIDWRDVSDRCLEALGATADPLAVGLLAVNEPLGWIAAGADLDLDVLPTIRALAAKGAQRGRRIGSWAYFATAVAEARERRLRGLPAVVVPIEAGRRLSRTQEAIARIKARQEAEAAARTEVAHG